MQVHTRNRAVLAGFVACAATSTVASSALGANHDLVVPIHVNVHSLAERMLPPIPASLHGQVAVTESGLRMEYAVGSPRVDVRVHNGEIITTLDARVSLQFIQQLSIPSLQGENTTDSYDIPLADCGVEESARRVRVVFATHLTPRGDWSIGTETRVVSREMIDRCEVTMLGLDASPWLLEGLDQALQAELPKLDATMSSDRHLRTMAQQAWGKAWQPISLGSGAWLALRPRSISVSPFEGTGSTLSFSVGLQASPEVRWGESFASGTPRLPALRTMAKHAPGVSLAVQARAGYHAIETTLESELGQRPMRWNGLSLQIDNASVGAWSDMFTVKLEGSVAHSGLGWGSESVTLTVAGIPQYDAAHDVLALTNVNTQVNSDSVLLDLAQGVLGDTLNAQIAARTVVHPGVFFAKVQDLVNAQLTRSWKGVSVRGHIATPSLVSIRAAEQGIVARVSIRGRVEVTVE